MIPGELLTDGPDLVLNPGRRTATVVSNWSDGAWPICRLLGEHGW